MNTSYHFDAERIVVLDTETTGMNRDHGPHYEGHGIVEIGAVELINRRLTGRHFHVYIKPEYAIDPEAILIHGITDEFLQDKPSYAQVHDEFIEFIQGAELVAHNASFDLGFMNYELSKLATKHVYPYQKIEDICRVTDTLAMAKQLFPGKRNNLDVLCERYGIDNSHRVLHGALLDAEILADVYLLMTGGQTSFELSSQTENAQRQGLSSVTKHNKNLKVLRASADEIQAHQERLDLIEKNGICLWRQ